MGLAFSESVFQHVKRSTRQQSRCLSLLSQFIENYRFKYPIKTGIQNRSITAVRTLVVRSFTPASHNAQLPAESALPHP
jgi:hypothetical protein